jgi:uncharacterized protein YbjQ (UPF0145 family)
MTEGYKPYLESIESVLETTNSTALGLSKDESAKRLETVGPNKLIEAKKSAQSKMIRRAIGCGANAVLGIKFDVTSLTSGLLMVSINGTAVEVEKI